MTLLNESYVREVILRDAKYKESHGATETNLGSGLLYYTLTYMLKAKVCLCLGSGGGFVPRLMRQAQRDLRLADSQTILVDANIVNSGWGCPDYFHDPSHFTTEFSEIKIMKMTTKEAASKIGTKVDYLHIDADHGYKGVKLDWTLYHNMVGTGIITIHDTNSRIKTCGVKRLLKEIEGWEMVNFPAVGEGVAILRKKQFKFVV